jgi:hypothetical protein
MTFDEFDNYNCHSTVHFRDEVTGEWMEGKYVKYNMNRLSETATMFIEIKNHDGSRRTIKLDHSLVFKDTFDRKVLKLKFKV